MDAAHQLLKQHGGNGCQTSLPAETRFQAVSDDTIQILHNRSDHWMCSASTKGVVYLADNLAIAATESLKMQTREIYYNFKYNNGTLEIELIKEVMQAIISIAFAFAVSGKVSAADYIQPDMRKHLIKCYDTMSVQPFPRKRLYNKF